MACHSSCPIPCSFAFAVTTRLSLSTRKGIFLPLDLSYNRPLPLVLIFTYLSHCTQYLPEINLGNKVLCGWQNNFYPLPSDLLSAAWLPHSLCLEAVSTFFVSTTASRVQVGTAKFCFWSPLCVYSDNSRTVTYLASVSYYASRSLQNCRIKQVISLRKASFCYFTLGKKAERCPIFGWLRTNVIEGAQGRRG